ncbi:hypothetical protein J6590_076813 [Homalodisca vitripennis]|nr:hypothetical protein J6590_076813 [Homalodisca vitripennis]
MFAVANELAQCVMERHMASQRRGLTHNSVIKSNVTFLYDAFQTNQHSRDARKVGFNIANCFVCREIYPN